MSADQLAEWEAACGDIRRSILDGQRPTFTARAVPDGSFWYIEVDGVPRYGDCPGAFTQARTRAEIELMARSATELVLDVPPESFDLVVEATGDGPA
jgi:hypothetical protein